MVVDGCPPRLKLTESDIQPDSTAVGRASPKSSHPARNPIPSGSLGHIRGPNPRHADLPVGQERRRPLRGLHGNGHEVPPFSRRLHVSSQIRHPCLAGRRAHSARETVGRVAAGAIAKKLLRERYGVEILACVQQVERFACEIDPETVRARDIESNIVRCPDAVVGAKMIRLIERVRKAGDTIGGIIAGIARGVPPGWGEPVFDRLEADLAKAMLSLPASKGFDVGSGFDGILLTGMQHNDPFRAKAGKVYTTSNRSGGIQGGISNGATIYFRVAFKPVATVLREQQTVDTDFKNTTLKARGRHDPCVLPRAVPIVEAMTALVLADHALRHKAQCG